MPVGAGARSRLKLLLHGVVVDSALDRVLWPILAHVRFALVLTRSWDFELGLAIVTATGAEPILGATLENGVVVRRVLTRSGLESAFSSFDASSLALTEAGAWNRHDIRLRVVTWPGSLVLFRRQIVMLGTHTVFDVVYLEFVGTVASRAWRFRVGAS